MCYERSISLWKSMFLIYMYINSKSFYKCERLKELINCLA
uniref:Uncharacterized protein n=1 Tax=Scytodes thoracica TaxID=1112478 RepID=A0A0A0V690_SCYTH|nr:hypothetical protein [Scytodes thoracica]